MSAERKIEALRAMAERGTPNERDIARRKLRVILAIEEAKRPESHWERMQRAEAEREARQAAVKEAEIARIVERWERGGFAGLTVRSGAILDRAWEAVDA